MTQDAIQALIKTCTMLNEQVAELEATERKYEYKELSEHMLNGIKHLIRKYENEGSYDVVEDLRKIITP